MSKEREALLEKANDAGLVLGVDFQSNISSKNLKTKIDEKNAAVENQLKGAEDTVEEKCELLPLEAFKDADELEEYGKKFDIDLDKRKALDAMYADLQVHVGIVQPKETVEPTPTPKPKKEVSKTPAVEESEDEETYEDEVKIKRISPCGNYKVNIIGYKEAARRTDVTIEEIKQSIENGKPTKNGWSFELV